MQTTFEERHSRFMRNALRLSRALRWRVKGLLGRPRTLLVELRWRLGDEIMALPFFESLRTQHPGIAVDVLTNYPELFEGNAFVNAVNPSAPDPDSYLLLRGASRSSHRLGAYCARAGVPVPVARPILYFSDWSAPQLSAIPEGDGPLIALALGASWPSKRWPVERWQDLAARLEEEGCRVVVLGQSGEGLDRGVDLCGATSVREAACLLHASDLAVCCDSGLMHLALAAGTPVVALFGPTDPDFLIRNEPRLTALRSTQSCSGFWNHAAHVGEPGACPEGHACCLDSISVDQAMAAIHTRIRHGGAY
jgi:ADP-heptose:LPS heptosyltransferase